MAPTQKKKHQRMRLPIQAEEYDQGVVIWETLLWQKAIY